MARPGKIVLAMHVARLLREHGIVRKGRCPFSIDGMPRWARAWGDCVQRVVGFDPVVSTRSYIVALHEIGHIAGGFNYTASEEPWSVAEAEALTWEWVQETALPGSLDALAMETLAFVMRFNVDSVDKLAEQLECPAWMLLPPASNTFWALLGRPRDPTWPDPECLEGDTKLLYEHAKLSVTAKLRGQIACATVPKLRKHFDRRIALGLTTMRVMQEIPWEDLLPTSSSKMEVVPLSPEMEAVLAELPPVEDNLSEDMVSECPHGHSWCSVDGTGGLCVDCAKDAKRRLAEFEVPWEEA